MSFRASYDQRCDEHLDGTGSWFLASDEYNEWKSSNTSDLLWVSGKPGCGKSVLAAVIVADLKLELEPQSAIAYAFCRREDRSSQSPAAILGSLASQISQQQDGINSEIEKEFSSSKHGEEPSQRTIRMLMRSVLSYSTKLFIVVDGLDECENNDQLAQDLRDFVQQNSTSAVKIIILSRHEYLLEECFKPYRRIQPDLGANEIDLKAYIESLFPDDSEANVNQEIRKECVAKADGMFLWVKLLWKSLQKPLNSKQKLKRIKDTPAGLKNMYDRILKDIWDQDEDVRSIAFLVLMWTTHARRPLRRFEMLEAVADYSEANSLAEAFKHTNPEHLVAICANLVFIDQAGRFRLCHESVRGYLDDIPSEPTRALAEYRLLKKTAHTRLAEICLTYLLLKDFECGPVTSYGRILRLLKKYPFLEYAAQYWGWHISDENVPLLQAPILEVILSQQRRELSMQLILSNPIYSRFQGFSGSTNPLHLLSIFGIRQPAEALTDVGQQLQEADESGSTPLDYALSRRHHEMTLWIIEKSSDMHNLGPEQAFLAIQISAGLGWIDVLKNLVYENEALAWSKHGNEGSTPLTSACEAGEVETAALLIDAKADVNLKNTIGDSPLIVAAENNNRKLVELLLENGADPNCSDAEGMTPLHFAAVTGDLAMAVVLMKKGADVLAKAFVYSNILPCHVAAQYQRTDILKALYNEHPNLDMRTRVGSTPLHIAAMYNSSKAAQVLLELGVPKDAIDNDQRSALYLAALKGHLDVVKVLIAAGCDASLGANGKTAVHAAATSGKLPVLRCIMKGQTLENWQVLLNKVGVEGQSTLHCACEGGSKDIVKFLLRAGANGTVKGRYGLSPLHLTVKEGQKEIARLLLQYTKEPSPRDDNGDTPIHLAARRHMSDFIKQFFQDVSDLGLSVDINAQNHSKATPVMVALDEGCEDVAILFIQLGCDLTSDIDDNQPIHLAAWFGFDSIVETLLSRGDSSIKGYFGRTALNGAALQGLLKTVKLLASQPTNVLEVADNRGRTPVLSALSRKHYEVANYLLDIHADHNAVDNHGDGLLHLAAKHGNISMIRRLLSLGCRPNVINRYGMTPLLTAVENDHLEAVEALAAIDPDTVHTCSFIGASSIMFAAENGNLEMIQKLAALGAKFGLHGPLYRNAARFAAYGGHWEILDYLRDHGEDLYLADVGGFTPLLVAASRGFLDTVKFLLDGQPHVINDTHMWDGSSPLLEAAQRAAPLSIRYLLSRGGDPYLRDAFGFNAMDYASRHPPSLREMHQAGHFHDRDALIKGQRQIVCKTVRDCCVILLQTPLEPSLAEIDNRLAAINRLPRALLRLQDYELAKLCYMDLLWQPEFALLTSGMECEFCEEEEFDGNRYVCKSCYTPPILCDDCHDDYIDAGRRTPEAIEEIMQLERTIETIRDAIPVNRTLPMVSQAMTYFQAGSGWVAEVVETYGQWEQKYDASKKYDCYLRPGQEFIKLIDEANKLVRKLESDDVADAEDWNSLSDLKHKYKIHRRQWRTDRTIGDYLCRNHDYLLVSADDREKVKSVGRYLNSGSGQLTRSFIQEIKDKYTGDQVKDEAFHNVDWLENLPLRLRAREVSKVLSEPETASRGDTRQSSRSRSLDGSAEMSFGRRRRRLSEGLTSFPTMLTGLAPTSLPQRSKQDSFRRGMTLPPDASNPLDSRRQSIEVQMKDTRVLTAVQAQLGSTTNVRRPSLSATESSRPVVKNVGISLAEESDGTPEQKQSIIRPANNEVTLQAASPTQLTDVPMLASMISSEPESADKSIFASEELNPDCLALTTIPEQAESTSDGGNSYTKSVAKARMNYMILHGEDATDLDKDLWAFGLYITDVMIPGFSAGYWRSKTEEREQAEEDEAEAEAQRSNQKLGVQPRKGSDDDSDDDNSDADFNDTDDEPKAKSQADKSDEVGDNETDDSDD